MPGKSGKLLHSESLAGRVKYVQKNPREAISVFSLCVLCGSFFQHFLTKESPMKSYSLLWRGMIILSIIIVLSGSLSLFAADPPTKFLKPVEYNGDQLVRQAVQGFIAPPWADSSPYNIAPDGEIYILPGTGSITYNFRAGDTAVNLAGDHVEPAVTLYNPGSSGSRSSGESRGFNLLSCIGNRVLVLEGEAKGAEGVVIGKHGGAEHVMVDFSDDAVFDKLQIGDKMRVYAHGAGLVFKNMKDIKGMNIGPELIEALTQMGMGVTDKGKLMVPVTHLVPAKIMGSGLGSSHVYRGDYDIQMFDEKTVKEFGLSTLRLSDVIAIVNADHTYGRIYKTGAVSIGVISHSDSKIAGHGPGVTTILTSASGNIEPFITKDANLAKLLNIR